jgi:hypothetical protein
MVGIVPSGMISSEMIYNIITAIMKQFTVQCACAHCSVRCSIYIYPASFPTEIIMFSSCAILPDYLLLFVLFIAKKPLHIQL